jgi:hypothetical protein
VTRTRSLIGLALASTVLLTGCNASGWNPGVAAHVAGETITLAEVQDTTSSYCEAVETQLEEGSAVANGVVSAQVAGSLALRSAAEQWAALEGLEPDESFETQADALDQALAGLSEEQQEAVRSVNLAQPYLTALELAYGQQQDSGADDEAATQAGQEAFADWLDGEDVRIDPRYTVTIDGGTLGRTTTDISLPVSDLAKKAVSGEPDETYAAGLPSSQRCGG